MAGSLLPCGGDRESAKAIASFLFPRRSPQAIFTGILAESMPHGDHEVGQTNETFQSTGGIPILLQLVIFPSTPAGHRRRVLQAARRAAKETLKGRNRAESPPPRTEIRGEEGTKKISGREAA